MKPAMAEVTACGAQTGVELVIYNVVSIKLSEQAKGSVSKEKIMYFAYLELKPKGPVGFNQAERK